jgi:tetratricopeptide (TPR) repeat protein
VDARRLVAVIPRRPPIDLNAGMEGTAALHPLPPVTPAYVDAPVSNGRTETVAVLQRAEKLIAEHRYDEAVHALFDVRVPAVSSPDLALRVILAEGWAQLQSGRVELADATLGRACGLAEGHAYTGVDRAESLFRLGACRLTRGQVTNAVSLFTVALGLAEHGSIGGDHVAARALEWRARAYVRQREWEAAQADAERSLELADQLRDDRLRSLSLMQCSVIAERHGDARLALFYAERAHTLAVDSGDRRTEARLLNNMGGLRFLLGEAEQAVPLLQAAYALFLELGNDADAAQVVSSLAQVHLRCGAPQLAEEQARHALAILDDRDDYLDERGNVHLVLGRALLRLDRDGDAMTQFAAAEWLFERYGSASHLAAAWMAQGEAYARAGDLEASVELYRRAAEALQDVHF